MRLTSIQNHLFNIFKKCRLIPKSTINIEQLDKHTHIAKQLDEYRELINLIEEKTEYFGHKENRWSIAHARALDDYLVELFTLIHEAKPDEVRPPSIPLRIRDRPMFLNPHCMIQKAK